MRWRGRSSRRLPNSAGDETAGAALDHQSPAHSFLLSQKHDLPLAVAEITTGVDGYRIPAIVGAYYH
jgi:hypothetical protein